MSQTRREIIKKAAVGGAVVWAAPTVISSTAYAQGTPACSGFSVTDVIGPECDPVTGDGTWRIQINKSTTDVVTLTASGCQSGGPVPTVDGARVTVTVPQVLQPCCQTFLLEEFDGTGALICSETYEYFFDCPVPPQPTAGPGASVPGTRSADEPGSGIVITQPDGTTETLGG